MNPHVVLIKKLMRNFISTPQAFTDEEFFKFIIVTRSRHLNLNTLCKQAFAEDIANIQGCDIMPVTNIEVSPGKEEA